MDDTDRFSQLNAEQTAELLKQLTQDEVTVFYKMDDFDEFIENTSHLDAPQFAQLAKVAAHDSIAQAQADKAERAAFAQLPASDKFARRSKGPCIGLGWGVGLVTLATDGAIFGIQNSDHGFLLGIGGGCATYGVSRLLVLAVCEVMKRRENSASRPAHNPENPPAALNHDKA